jgi:hypothetical protein
LDISSLLERSVFVDPRSLGSGGLIWETRRAGEFPQVGL